MHMATLLAGAAALAATTAGTPLARDTTYAVKDTHNVPCKWERVGPAPGEHVLNMQIGLKQARFEELERHLYEGMWKSHSGGEYLWRISE